MNDIKAHGPDSPDRQHFLILGVGAAATFVHHGRGVGNQWHTIYSMYGNPRKTKHLQLVLFSN